jgi:hypothetical protein
MVSSLTDDEKQLLVFAITNLPEQTIITLNKYLGKIHILNFLKIIKIMEIDLSELIITKEDVDDEFVKLLTFKLTDNPTEKAITEIKTKVNNIVKRSVSSFEVTNGVFEANVFKDEKERKKFLSNIDKMFYDKIVEKYKNIPLVTARNMATGYTLYSITQLNKKTKYEILEKI